MNNWKKIWNEKGKNNAAISFDLLSTEEGFSECKRLMGITILEGTGASYDGLLAQFKENLKEMTFSLDDNYEPESFFDVGCGSGSYLFLLSRLLHQKNLRLGGLDFSESLINIAKQAVGNYNELYCSEAAELDTEIKYDVVFSRSIFQYFSDEEYARKTTEKMLEKAIHSIAILDVHDLKKRDKFIEYRRGIIKDYDKKYADIPHLFLSKEMFIDIAEKNNCSIKFAHSPLPNYWNSDFTYDIYMFK